MPQLTVRISDQAFETLVGYIDATLHAEGVHLSRSQVIEAAIMKWMKPRVVAYQRRGAPVPGKRRGG